MQNEVKVFNFNSFELEVVAQNDEQWFIASPLATYLEYKNASEAIRTNVDEDDIAKIYIPEKSNNYVCVNESGLYSLVLRSNKPEAKSFKKWVTSEVLPSIRKTGQYGLKQPPTAAEMFFQSAQVLLEQDRKLTEVVNKVESIESKVSTMQIDLRNGVPFGCISKSNAWLTYGSGVGEKVFKEAMLKLNIPTQNYVHHGDGFSKATFAYEESYIQPQ